MRRRNIGLIIASAAIVVLATQVTFPVDAQALDAGANQLGALLSVFA